MEMEQDIFKDYGYKPGQELLIQPEFLLAVLNFCEKVAEGQPKFAAPLAYAKNVNVITDRQVPEIIHRVDTEWEQYPTVQCFTNTAFSENGAIPIMTEIELLAFQIRNGIYNYHKSNVDNGIAVLVEQEDVNT